MPRGRKKGQGIANPHGPMFSAKAIPAVSSNVLGPLATMTRTQVQYAVRQSFRSREEYAAFQRWLKENDEEVFSYERVSYEQP